MNKEEQLAFNELGSMYSVSTEEAAAAKHLQDELRREKNRLRSKRHYEANKDKHRDYCREYQRRKRAEAREKRANMSPEELLKLEEEKLKKSYARRLKNIETLKAQIEALHQQ